MFNQGIEKIARLSQYHGNLLKRFAEAVNEKWLREREREVKGVRIQEARVGYKKGVNVSMKNGADQTKNLYYLVQAVKGKGSEETLICFY